MLGLTFYNPKAMKLELKKVSFSEALSQETNAFTADVYIDGVKRATAENDGHGGNTNVSAYAKPRQSPEGDAAYLKERNANRVFTDQYEAWAKQQPPIETNLKVEGGANFSYAHSLEADVDLLLEQWLKEKYAKQDAARMKRLCNKKWVFTLKEHKGKPTKPNSYFMMERAAHEDLAGMGKHLRAAHGTNLIEFLNEKYQ